MSIELLILICSGGRRSIDTALRIHVYKHRMPYLYITIMAAKRLNRTTLSIAPEVRDGLKHIARKDQTYNELFIDLINLYNDHTKSQSQNQDQKDKGVNP